MRFSAVAALCAAPLVLAGALEANVVDKRASFLDVRTDHLSESSSSKENNDNKKDDNSRDRNNDSGKKFEGGSSNSITVIQQSIVQDIIIIWVNNGGGAVTSTVTETKTVTAGSGSGSGPAGSVQTHEVIVGGTAGLVFTPESIVAAVGDMVVFTFQSTNHTVTQSSFDTPCIRLAGGMDSGFMPNPENSVTPAPQMAMQVTVATPIWFYCRAKTHCGKGMTFSINPTAAKSQANFKGMAIAQNGTGSASPIVGGAPAAAAPSTAAPPPPPPPSGGAVVGGNGAYIVGGACACSCLCGAATFPNVAVQGLNAFGGISGAIQMSALEG